MTGKQLRNSILQWAIQGKLVPQDPNDEPASVLLERIRAEKARLVKEKKIKKDKNETIIYRGEDNSYYEKTLATGAVRCIDSEIPFDIPQGWEWCRLGSLIDFSKQDSIRNEEIEPNVWLLDLEDIEKDTGIILRKKRMSETSAKSDKHKFSKGNVLYSKLRPYLNKVVIANEDGVCTSEILSFNFGEINNRYAQAYLMSPFFVEYAMSDAYGVKMPRLGSKQGNNALFPIPPLPEQIRIVRHIETLSSPIQRFSEIERSVKSLNVEIKDRLFKSILQEAIKGKLVPQIESEGTAEDLLAEVRAEKLRLVKEGKLKKSALANESRIFRGDDNKYYEQIGSETTQIECEYDFPTSWSIVRLSSVCSLLDGEKKEGQYICMDAKYLRGKSSGEYLNKGRFVADGQSIILVDGENSGEVFIVPHDGYMGSTFKQLWISEKLYKPYILSVIRFYKDLFRQSKKGAAIPHLNKEIFNNLLIGLPPLKEQIRIVKQIGWLFDMLE